MNTVCSICAFRRQPFASMISMQASRCGVAPAAPRLARPFGWTLPVPFAPARCSGRAGRIIVTAGPKKKLKKEMKELNMELERKLEDLEAAYAKLQAVQALNDPVSAALLARGSVPALQFGELALTAQELTQQAEELHASSVELLAGLRGLAARISALSQPVADTGFSAVQVADMPLLASPLEVAHAADTGRELSSGHEVPAAQAAGPAAASEQAMSQAPLVGGRPHQGLGVTVQSAAPAGNAAAGQPSARSLAEIFGRDPDAADEEAELQPFAAQVRAAMEAVNRTDVLKDNIDYMAEGEQLRQQAAGSHQSDTLQQGRASSAAATSPPPPPPAAGPPPAPTGASDHAAQAPVSGRPQLLQAPFGSSGVSLSKKLGRQPVDSISQQALANLRKQVYPSTGSETGGLNGSDAPGNWSRPASPGDTQGNVQQHPPEADADPTQEQLGDAGYYAAVQGAMRNLQQQGPISSSSPASAADKDMSAVSDQTAQAIAAATAAASVPAAEEAILTEEEPAVKETPTGQPLTLAAGADDIFWVNQLQAALLHAGCYPGEEEMEDLYFGDDTHSALLTFQAINGLEETGTADLATWKALLGPDLQAVTESPVEDFEAAEAQQGPGEHMDVWPPGPDDAPPQPDIAFAEAAAATAIENPASWERLFTEDELRADSFGVQPVGGVPQPLPVPPTPTQQEPLPAKWPVLRLDEGGKAVHYLQCGLEAAGCYPGEDDMLWWQFGTETEAALRTFQAMNGLPETGVSDAATWLAMLGHDAVPADLQNLHAADERFDDDMAGHTHDGAVWLVGEQRWSRPSVH